MFSLYSSFCQLLKPMKSVANDIITKNYTSTPTPTSIPTYSRSSSKISIIDNDNIMLKPSNNSRNIIAVNDAGESVILEYSIFDPMFSHYKPKSEKYNKKIRYY